MKLNALLTGFTLFIALPDFCIEIRQNSPERSQSACSATFRQTGKREEMNGAKFLLVFAMHLDPKIF